MTSGTLSGKRSGDDMVSNIEVYQILFNLKIVTHAKVKMEKFWLDRQWLWSDSVSFMLTFVVGFHRVFQYRSLKDRSLQVRSFCSCLKYIMRSRLPEIFTKSIKTVMSTSIMCLENMLIDRYLHTNSLTKTNKVQGRSWKLKN